MPLNKHVMTNAFRTGLTKVYRDALIDAGISADKAEIKPHIIGTAHVTVTDAELQLLRDKYGDKLMELSGHSNSGSIEILLPAGEKFLLKNRPTLTDEERAAKQSSGNGRGVSPEVKAAREAARERMNNLLKERFGIDVSENKADAGEDAEPQAE